MNIDMEDNILCCGCLCTGRKMVTVDEYWKKQCFLQIINEIPMTPPIGSPLWLCWECEALVTRFTSFKKQVKHCYKLLNNYVEQNLNTTQLHRPSRLSTQKVVDLLLHPDPDPDTKIDVTIDVVKIETGAENNEIKEEDNVSTYSDNVDDDRALIEYKSTKKKKKKEKKKKKKKVDEEDIIQEVELTPEEIQEERRMLAAREEYVNAMFRCERCLVSFPNADDLDDHVRLKHEANKSRFVCAVCTCSFASEVSHNYHSGKHRRRFRCGACGAAHAARRQALRHYRAAHARNDLEFDLNGTSHENGQADEKQKSNDGIKQESAVFPCEFCDKTFRWKTSLRKHVETHRIETGQKRKPYCEPCRLSFTTTSNLQKHVKTSSKHQIQLKLRKLTESHAGEPATAEKQQARVEQVTRAVVSARQQFACAQCGRRFQWRGNLARHLRSHRARAAGSLVCAPCNRTFSSIATYTQHMKISKKHVSEDDFKYMCSECGKKFANKTRLKDHVDWEHLKNYVHTCADCQKVFKSHTSLYLHRQVVHRKDSADHLCDHCGKHFPNHAKLRSHIVALHSATAPYKCSVCCARFSWHSCLSRHARRVHRADPPRE